MTQENVTFPYLIIKFKKKHYSKELFQKKMCSYDIKYLYIILPYISQKIKYEHNSSEN